MPEINMPKLSDTMEEGTVLEWKVKDGTHVKKGDVIAEIETDKASFEIEADGEGVLRVLVEAGKPVPVGAVIGSVGEVTGSSANNGGKAPAAEPKSAPKSTPRTEPAAPAVRAESARTRPSPAAGQATANLPGGVKASPIARRLAAEFGVDLKSIVGSGPDGRIVKEDVVAAGQATEGHLSSPTPAPRRPAGGEVEVIEATRMQSTIARRMVESKSTVPHFYATMEVRVDEAVRLRQQLKATVPAAEKLTMTDILVRACALALRKYPEVNASWVDGRFERKSGINIGLAVPPASGLGLLVPVIHDCERKDLVQISIESRQVIERARSGKPGDQDLSGGTFSISNLGMYGVDEFNAIINPPESAILAVGAIKEVPVVDAGQIRVGSVMRLTLSVDHRVFYGQTAALFLAEVRRLLEAPVSLVLPDPES